MDKLKTIKILERYRFIIENHDTSNDAYDFIRNFELELAKSMLNEFSKDSLSKFAHVLLVMTKESEIRNYTLPIHHSDYTNTGIAIG